MTRVTDFGAFVRLRSGVEGLLHVSEMADIRPDHPQSLVSPGDLLLLRVLRIEPERRRIGLSLRQVSETEWAEWAATYREKHAAAAAEEGAEGADGEVAAPEAAGAEMDQFAMVGDEVVGDALIAEEIAGDEYAEDEFASDEMAMDDVAAAAAPELELPAPVEDLGAALDEAPLAEAPLAEARCLRRPRKPWLSRSRSVEDQRLKCRWTLRKPPLPRLARRRSSLKRPLLRPAEADALNGEDVFRQQRRRRGQRLSSYLRVTFRKRNHPC